MIQGKTLDIQSFRSQKVQSKFPCVMLRNLNETTPLVVSMLEEGDLPLLAEYKGQKRIVKNISDSAYNIDKLIRTHGDLTYFESEDSVREIATVREYLEVIVGWIL